MVKKHITLGISAYYHDAAAALVVDGEIVAAAHQERFSRKKHDPSFPREAILYCLSQAQCAPHDVDDIVFYDKPFLKFERLLETYLAVAPRGIRSFLAAMPVWMKEKLYFKRMITRELSAIGFSLSGAQKLLFCEHHLSHSASAFYPSPFDRATIVTIDGVGEWATASIGIGEHTTVTILRELHFPDSVGLLYSAFTYFLGFRVNSGEYKLMGLAPYGDPSSTRVQDYERLIREHLVEIFEDGSIALQQKYFNYATGLTMIQTNLWETLFSMPRRTSEDEITQEHGDLALAIQRVTEDIVERMVKYAISITGCADVVLAGGVALNCVANTKLLDGGVVKRLWVQPAAGDAGGALGAALAVQHMYHNIPREVHTESDGMQASLLGPSYTRADIIAAVAPYGAKYEPHDSREELNATVADLLAQGKIVGWFQGRMEWGPRALGARSILADPRDKTAQKRLNLKIKFREGFRPFAPAILRERVADYFTRDIDAPYMLLVLPVSKARRVALPKDYHKGSWQEKLYFVRSDIPAVTHLDFSARVQTVSKEAHPTFYNLIKAFDTKTGCPLVVNTSFNVRGEPIVCTPLDAYLCFMRTEMDYLVMEDVVFEKSQQPKLKLEAGPLGID